MEPIDRVYRTLCHEEPDKVPDGRDMAGVSSEVIKSETIKAGPGLRVWRSSFGSVHLDYVNPSTGADTGIFEEGWVAPENLVWWYTIAPAVRWPEDLEHLEQPRFDVNKLKDIKKRVRELHEQGYFVVTSHHSPFDCGWRYLRGLKQWLIDLVRDPAFARRLIKFAMEPQIEAAEILLDEAGIDGVWSSGDQGTPEGPFLPPRLYKDLIYPWDRRLCHSYHKRGAFVFTHSHGYIVPILDEMIKAGFDVINPVSPLCRMNLVEMKEKYGDKLTFYAELTTEQAARELESGGKIDTSSYTQMRYGHDSKSRIEALAYTVRTAAPGGGFIFSEIVRRETMTEEQKLYMKAWERLRQYPISA